MNGREYDWKLRADAAIKAHGLWDLGWRFKYDNRKNALGGCNKNQKLIKLSKFGLRHSSDETARDTLFHEIAHALAWHHDRCWDHGPVWKMWARRVGATPSATSPIDTPIQPHEYNWVMIDSRNKKVIRGWFRKPRAYPPSRVKRMFLPSDPSSMGHLEIVRV